MIPFAVRTLIATITFVILRTARHLITGHPMPTAGEWVAIVILVAIVTELINRIDRRYFRKAIR